MKKLLITCVGISLCLVLYLAAGLIVAGSGDGTAQVVSCLGDSITEGIPYSGTENTYPARLQVMLDTAYGEFELDGARQPRRCLAVSRRQRFSAVADD
jgi:hypothetical protein